MKNMPNEKVETDREKLRKESEDEALRRQQEDLTSDIPSEQPQEGDAEAPVIDLKDFDPKKLEFLEESGVPLKKLVDWVNTTDATLRAIKENLPQQVQTAMEQAIANAQRKQRIEYAQAVADGKVRQGGGGIGLGDILRLVGGGGGGGDAELLTLQKDMMRASIDNMKKDANASRLIVSAVVSKITGKAIGDVIKEL